MQHNEWIAARIVLERHRELVADSARSRELRPVRRARPSAARRRLATVLASLAARLDPERGVEMPTRLTG